jgi:hypothetical protein
MIRYDSVLAFGDSHVAGCELMGQELVNTYINGNLSLEDMDSQTKPFAFPNLVANSLNIPCYNYALSGGSNSRSLRLLPQALADHPNSLVLFFYTEPHRIEMYYPDKGNFYARDNTNYIQLGVQWSGKQFDHNLKTHPINKYFVKNMLRVNDSGVENILFYVDQACKNLSANYLHIFGFDNAFNTPKNVDAGKILSEDFNSWCLKQGYEQLPLHHYNQTAHRAFADLILLKLGQ